MNTDRQWLHMYMYVTLKREINLNFFCPNKVEFLSWMVKIKTHQVLLQTPLDVLKPDIATMYMYLNWLAINERPTEEELNKRTPSLYVLSCDYVLYIHVS